MTPAERAMQFVFRLRSAGVTDVSVLKAMEEIDRSVFVENLFRPRAFDDTALPISCGQTISAPSIVGLMTQALDLSPRSHVLEIGTGSGYQALVLGRLARRVWTVERHKALAISAHQRLQELGASNVVVMCGDGSHGLPEQAPFDRILVTAAAEDVPGPLLAQLKPGGVLVMPVGLSDHSQKLIKVMKSETGLRYKELQTVRFVPLLSGVAAEVDD